MEQQDGFALVFSACSYCGCALRASPYSALSVTGECSNLLCHLEMLPLYPTVILSASAACGNYYMCFWFNYGVAN